ncbi:Separase [Thalictrum thalictroides]|uniref:Separase n=1 Tax=Thalictrum thalictroides TaxID=46969 RepID=A0A7J6X1F6_THATH|nr:Separase [Thalictrum thalictroides]
MDCSSGCLSFMGSYNPQGVFLSYLPVGTPAIVANLWEVTDKDIDRFGKAMLCAWLLERSTSGFNPRNLVEEFESMNIASSEENGARDVSRSRRFGSGSISSTLKNTRCYRPKIGSFMSQAREACVLPVLIGASPVCYGVPTADYFEKHSSVAYFPHLLPILPTCTTILYYSST